MILNWKNAILGHLRYFILLLVDCIIILLNLTDSGFTSTAQARNGGLGQGS